MVAATRSCRGVKYVEPLNPYGLLCGGSDRPKMKSFFRWADVIHCHDDCYPALLRTAFVEGKKLVYHAHIGDIPERFFRGKNKRWSYDPRVGHACITNGYGRLFDMEEKHPECSVKWHRLPDILDINHPELRPCPEIRPRGLRAVFAFSNRKEKGGKLNAKCPKETTRLLRRARGVSTRFLFRRPYSEVMAEMKAAHVVVDDLFSPYTHLCALEGACVGACVLTYYDDQTRKEVCNYLGAPEDSYPFIRTDEHTILERLDYYRRKPQKAIEAGKRARAWMEKYYEPKRLLERYLEFYSTVEKA